ncbi:MAG TPA: serine/threonine-protein kinase, partial [Stackebrandtia sp.]|uniref:serine/threonine-protein kinase n=1 Tax=Stackebrandtia sp. TaxID=2023065 RepID=UPI002D2A687A
MTELRGGDPRQIGPYRLESRLGAGGKGQVFLGIAESGQRVAVRLLKPELADEPEFRGRFAREVDTARTVDSLHVASIMDGDASADPPWLATEYLPGASVYQRVSERGPLGPYELRDLGIRLARGLVDIHRRGLVHGDLKPGNVILTNEGPKIIDFGTSRAADASTLTAAAAGTYAYMSPEQITSDRATPASDVFALGCVLAFAATGAGPFDAPSVPAIVHQVTSEEPRLDAVP